MRSFAPCLGLLLLTSVAWAQDQRPSAPRGAPLSPAQLRQQAQQQGTQLTEWRTLLNDPDVNLRLIAIREAVRHPDPNVRQIALEVGLASEEAAILEAALRGLLAGTQRITFVYVDKEGRPLEGQNEGRYILNIEVADADAGRYGGATNCNGRWTGQLQGRILAFASTSDFCAGTATWSPERGEFRGRMRANGSSSFQEIVWRPR
ncbi:hypothetical protein [Roseomonas sp. WA12]